MFSPREVSVLGEGGRKTSIFLYSVGIYMGTASLPGYSSTDRQKRGKTAIL